MPDLLSPDAFAAALKESEWSADELIPFGKYMLLDRISGGGTSAVYRANVRGEAGFERLVAIKRILPHMAGDPEFVKTFVREAKTVARLTHANICPIYELGKVGESLYMAIEYIAGKDLGKITRRLARGGQTMPPVVAAFIAARLCDALDYAHSLRNSNGSSAGVVHRDLSPTNILVSYEGQVKLIDFGLAKAVGRAQQTNVDALKKKLGYMSPEMVKGKPLDSRSDIFGVGVSLYEMLTGRRLFVGKDDIDTLKLVGTANVPPPSAVSEDVPDDLEVVVMRALEREPEDRFQTAGEMGQILNAYVHRTSGAFTTQTLSEWVLQLFAMEVIAENARIKRLLAASADNALMNERRAFFASPTGAAARARAEIQRRLSSDPPPSTKIIRVSAPPPAPIPHEARPRPVQPHDDQEEENTSFYDRDKTKAGPAEGVHAAETRLAPAHPNDSGFDDEPTNYVNASSAYAPNSVPPSGGFDEEKTQFLQELELQALTIPAIDHGHGGFEDEPTHIFFNKEEGVGVPSLLAEINDVQDVPRGLNKPIIAGDLGMPQRASQVPQLTPLGVFAPPPAGLPPAPPPRGGSTRHGTLPGLRPSAQLAAQLSAAAAVPAGAPLPAVPVLAPVLPPVAPAVPRSTSRTAIKQRDSAPSSTTSNVLLVAVTLGLLGVIAALIMLTPLGVALGLRAPRIGAIEVRTDPPARVSVLLDEVHRGNAPLRLDRVPTGLHRIEVRGAGYASSAREVTVSNGTTVLVQLKLEPAN